MIASRTAYLAALVAALCWGTAAAEAQSSEPEQLDPQTANAMGKLLGMPEGSSPAAVTEQAMQHLKKLGGAAPVPAAPAATPTATAAPDATAAPTGVPADGSAPTLPELPATAPAAATQDPGSATSGGDWPAWPAVDATAATAAGKRAANAATTFGGIRQPVAASGVMKGLGGGIKPLAPGAAVLPAPARSGKPAATAPIEPPILIKPPADSQPGDMIWDGSRRLK